MREVCYCGRTGEVERREPALNNDGRRVAAVSEVRPHRPPGVTPRRGLGAGLRRSQTEVNAVRIAEGRLGAGVGRRRPTSTKRNEKGDRRKMRTILEKDKRPVKT